MKKDTYNWSTDWQ